MFDVVVVVAAGDATNGSRVDVGVRGVVTGGRAYDDGRGGNGGNRIGVFETSDDDDDDVSDGVVVVVAGRGCGGGGRVGANGGGNDTRNSPVGRDEVRSCCCV